MRGEWEATLVDAVRDPDTKDKVTALDPSKRAVIERLAQDGRLPDVVDTTFVAAINAALERFVRRNATAQRICGSPSSRRRHQRPSRSSEHDSTTSFRVSPPGRTASLSALFPRRTRRNDRTR